MIRQVIIVEGKSDEARIKQAVEADVITTGGLSLRAVVVEEIRFAYEKRGIIILTDPDGPGEKIRKRLTRLFPDALHAFIPKSKASTSKDVGIENASCESIREALLNLKINYQKDSKEFSMKDLIENNLSGAEKCVEKRNKVGALLGIGYGNSKQFLKKLNHFGITRADWNKAIRMCGDEND